MSLLKSMLIHSEKLFSLKSHSPCLLKDILVISLIWLLESQPTSNSLKNHAILLTSLSEPYVIDYSHNMPLLLFLTLMLLIYVTKPLLTPKIYQLMPKINSLKPLPNSLLSNTDLIPDKLKEMVNTLPGLPSMLNIPPVFPLVKMLSTLLLPSPEVPSSSNSKEELRVLLTDSNK